MLQIFALDSKFQFRLKQNNNTIGIYTAYGTTLHDIFDNDIDYNWSGVSLTNNSDVKFYNNVVQHSSYVNLNCYVNTYGPELDDNKIRYCTSGNGVNLNYSAPFLEGNFIYDNDDYGIKCTESSPILGYDDKKSRNVVAYNGSYGIYIDNASHPTLGGSDPELEQNSYYSNNTYEIYSLFESVIYASHCYWGEGNPRVYGDIWAWFPLSYDPNPDPHSLPKSIAHKTVASSPEEIKYSESNKEARYYYDQGYELEQKGQYDAAIEKYDFVIDKYPKTLEAELSFDRNLICYSKTDRVDEGYTFASTLAEKNDSSIVSGKGLAHETGKLVLDGEYENALVNCSSLVEKYDETDIAKNALFTKWQIYFDGLKDMKNAKETMNQFEKSFPEDYLLAVMKIAMGEWTPEMEKQFMQKRNSNATSKDNITEKPIVFALLGNYPNPFNPETTIKYSLPNRSRVIIDVYNILGKRIKRLLDVYMPTGFHTVQWDGLNELGRKVGSGVYLCRMRSGNFVKIQKMMLMH